MAGEQVLGAELVLRSGGQRSPDAAIAAELPALDDIKHSPLPRPACC